MELHLARRASKASFCIGPVRSSSLLLLLLLVCTFGVSQAQSVDQRHTQAVLEAREGHYLSALKELTDLLELQPGNQHLLYDLLLVHFWAGNEAQAMHYFPRINSLEAPLQVLEAMARIARNAGEYPMALRYYTDLLSRQADSQNGRLGYAMTLAETGDVRQARESLQQMLRAMPHNQATIDALIYISELDQDYVWLSFYFNKLLELNPSDLKLARAYIHSLSQLGAVHLALEAAAQYPQALQADEHAQLRTDLAAATIRWGELAAIKPEQRYVDTDRALAALDQACQCDWLKLDLGKPANRRLVYDRMIALRDRKRMSEVLEHESQILAAGLELPDYVLLTAADAHLYLRHPKQARELYEQVLSQDEQNYNAQLSLFYALLELGEYHQARRLVENLASHQPVWRSRWGTRSIKDNPRRFNADLVAALSLAYADDLEASEERLEQMQQLAPINTDIANELANVWRWRGWQEKAEAKYLQLFAQEPELLGAEIGAAASALDLRRYTDAEQRIHTLQEDHAYDLGVQQLARRWYLHTRPELRWQTRVGDSTGGTNGSHDVVADGWLYSSPFDQHYRVFLHNHFSEARFTEGFGQNIRPGIGIQYRDFRWQASAELAGGLANNTDPGLLLNAAYRWDDHWSFDTALEWNSMQMPLRGQRVGVKAQRLGLSGSYRWHESQTISLAYNLLDMNDGNTRQSLSSSFEKRLVSLPDYKLTGRVSVFASDNSKQGVTYYNPDSDASVELTLDNLWRLYRFYEREFSHRLRVGMGRYLQQGIGTNATWSLNYEHIWSLNDQVQLVYGVSRSRRVYDDLPEFQVDYYGNLNIRF